MAPMRLSAPGCAASSVSTSMRAVGCVGSHRVPQPSGNSGTNVAATLNHRHSVSSGNPKKSSTAFASVTVCPRRTKYFASLLTTAAMVTCQAENQAVQNKQKVVSKAPSGSKEKSFTPDLDDGGIGGGPGGKPNKKALANKKRSQMQQV